MVGINENINRRYRVREKQRESEEERNSFFAKFIHISAQI